jgi:hypothetical protein
VPLPSRLDVLVRIDRQPPRRAEWVTNEDTLALPAYFDEVTNILNDLRAGTTFAARLFLFGGVEDAAQPTFQFDVTGFAEVERQLGCGSAASAGDDPFAAPPSAPAPSDPGTAAPSASGLPTASWEVLGSGPETLAIADGGRGATLIATCEVESSLPIALVLIDDGPAAGRSFSVRFADGDVLELDDVGDGLYQVVPAGIPALGGTQVLIAGSDPSGFDVTAVFPDGSEALLLRASGGDGFYAAWDALPCTGQPASEAPAPQPAPSTPGRSGAGSPSASAVGSGSWSLDPTADLFGYTDAQGRTFGFICGVTDDGTPAIFLDLPGVPVAASDGLARFDFARASGVGGSARWNFAVVSDGLFVTDTVATDDIAFKLLPDTDADPWNTVVVGVAGGAASVMVVPGEDLVAEFYTRLTCVQ